MNHGFFTSPAALTKPRVPLLPQCGACGLHKLCRSPKMRVDGNGKRKILIVGEGPGQTEDGQGRPFVGKTGRYLESTLDDLGIDLREDCWLTNSVICRPHTDKNENRTPSDKEVAYCRPNVVNIVKDLKPNVIIPLGGPAVDSVIGWLWREDVGPISRWVGWRIPSQQVNAWVCPTWHPSFVVRSEEERDHELVKREWRKHLKAAVAKKGRPWGDSAPNYHDEVNIEMSTSNAAIGIAAMHTLGDPVAFDFETDRLKPDHKESRIISCSVSNGINTVAYPWVGDVIDATRELLMSDVPKIGYNIKFEDRWCRKMFGKGVRNWTWDAMLAAHVLDNRPGITGLKFQAFAVLGVDSYEDKVKPYMKADGGGNARNRLDQCDLKQVLLYNGMDALLEWQLAQAQMKKLKVSI